MSLQKKGMMFILSSPSGVGKTTLTKKIAKNNASFRISVSHTTRTPRSNEVDGKDYYFVNEKEFNSLIKNNSFFEYAKIFNNFYGTLKEPVIKILSEKQDVLFDIDWQGTQQLKKNKDLSLVTFFILPPNIETLKQRLLNRHKGQEELIKQRMDKFNEEISHWQEYDYVVVNDNLEICYNNIFEIIKAEKEGISKKMDVDKIRMKVEELTK